MKKIAIYGTGLDGEKFYCRFKENYNILYAIDEDCNRNFHNLEVYSPLDINKLPKVEKIVITSTQYYREIKDVLISLGKEEIKDFCGSDMLEKELCIVYGNCHLSYIAEYLKSNFYFHKKFFTKVYFVHENATEKELYPSDEELRRCSLLIAQDIQDGNSVGAYSYEYLSSKLGKECNKIKVPNTFGMNIYFPQFNKKNTQNEIKEKHLNRTAIKKDTYINNSIVSGIIGHRDFIVETLIKQGKETQEIIDLFDRHDFFEDINFEDLIDKELEKLKVREASCSFIISDFIENNYKKEKLFYDPYHPSKALLIEKANRILNILNIECYNTGKNIMPCDQNELFIYGCVKRKLGLLFDDRFIKVNNQDYTLINSPIDIYEYIEEYKLWI